MTTENKAYIHPKTGNIVLPKCRIAWPALFAPSKMRGQDDKQAKHQATFLIPENADINALRTAAKEAATDKFGSKAGGSGIRSPFRKTAEKENLSELADDFPIFINARSTERPGVVGPNGKPVEDPEQVYSGRWVRATVQAFAYDTNGNKGVSFGLQNVQLLDHDDPLAIGGGRVAAEAEFEAADGAGDDTKSSDDIFG